MEITPRCRFWGFFRIFFNPIIFFNEQRNNGGFVFLLGPCALKSHKIIKTVAPALAFFICLSPNFVSKRDGPRLHRNRRCCPCPRETLPPRAFLWRLCSRHRSAAGNSLPLSPPNLAQRQFHDVVSRLTTILHLWGQAGSGQEGPAAIQDTAHSLLQVVLRAVDDGPAAPSGWRATASQPNSNS